MAQSINLPYGDVGVKIPYFDPGPDNEWSKNDKIQKDGFLLVKIFQPDVFLVQSIGNGRLYVNKLLRVADGGPTPREVAASTAAGGMVGLDGANMAMPVGGAGSQAGDDYTDSDDDSHDDSDDDDPEGHLLDDSGDYAPADDDSDDEVWSDDMEGRARGGMSMRGGAGGDSENGGNDGDDDDSDADSDADNNNDFMFTLPRETYFPHLVHWQRLFTEDNNIVYSIYYKYYNGGSVMDMETLFARKGKRVPEHFIWLVAEQLGEALAYMYFGRPRGSVGAAANQPNWRRVFHRDLYANNIFVHYPPPGRGRKGPYGERINAFPDIVAGDFGESYIEGNPRRFVSQTVDNQPFPMQPWNDIDGLSQTLRRLAMAHLEPVRQAAMQEIDEVRVRAALTVNNDDGDPPYSNALIDMLETLEWSRGPNDVAIVEMERLDGTHGYDDLPDINWVVDTMLMTARFQVETRRNNLPEGTDYRNLDMSWTKPFVRQMPWSCNHRHPRGLRDLERLSALNRWNDVRPPYEFQRLVFGPARPVEMGYGDDSARLAQPTFADPARFDRRGAEQGAVSDHTVVRRGFRAKAEGVLLALSSLAAHESARLDVGDPPSGSDAGSDGGPQARPPRPNLIFHPRTGDTLLHPRLARVQRRIDGLRAAVAKYQIMRDDIRRQGIQEPRVQPPDEGDDDDDDDGGDGDNDGGGDGNSDSDGGDNGGPNKRQKTG